MQGRSRPETRYATTREGMHVAFQVLGDGPRDVVFIPGWYSHLEALWDEPRVVHALRRLASFSRLILFDRRGFGLSDPVVEEVPTLEQWSDDLSAVLDETGSERASLVAATNGTPLALVFAATYPTRTSALVVFNGFARLVRADDYPAGVPQELLDQLQERRAAEWGTAADLSRFNPSVADDMRLRDWAGRYERQTASPGTARAMRRLLFAIDVRSALPLISSPTLIIHRADSAEIRVEHGTYLRDHISGARLVVLPGADTAYFAGDADELLDEIEEFITGAHPRSAADRMLAAVLFTDIVGSTEQASNLGDRRWKALLSDFEDAARAQISRFRGREIFVRGDEFMVTFDGPTPAVGCALEIRGASESLGVSVRTGIHVGEIERHGDDVTGIGVHIAARVMAEANAQEILVSRTVVDLAAGAGWNFAERGEHHLRGLPGAWQLFAVMS